MFCFNKVGSYAVSVLCSSRPHVLWWLLICINKSLNYPYFWSHSDSLKSPNLKYLASNKALKHFIAGIYCYLIVCNKSLNFYYSETCLFSKWGKQSLDGQIYITEHEDTYLQTAAFWVRLPATITITILVLQCRFVGECSDWFIFTYSQLLTLIPFI